MPQRRGLVAAMQDLARRGLNEGTAGNMAVRTDAGFLVTPSGVPADALEPGQMVLLDDSGAHLEGRLRPTSEWRFHQAILAHRPEVGAVVHCHSPHATALACLRWRIPAFHYMVALAGGDDIPLADYALFGTDKLSQAVQAALADRWACLLANHGQIAIGRDLEEAVALAQEVEALARQYLLACQAGEPVLLTGEEMAAVRQRFQGYGPDSG